MVPERRLAAGAKGWHVGRSLLQHACICTVLQQHVLCVISGHTLPYICVYVCVSVRVKACVFISPPVQCGGCACTFTIWSGLTLFLRAWGEGSINVIGCFLTQEVQKKQTQVPG